MAPRLTHPTRPARAYPQADADPHYAYTGPIRATFPASFLGVVAFALAAAIACLGAVSGGAIAAKVDVLGSARADGSCVCSSAKASQDLFPTKLKPKYAKGFTLEYIGNAKKITVFTAARTYTYAAYLCGTPVPAWAANDPSIQPISIPVRSASITTTTFQSFVEYLGQRASFRYVPTDVKLADACLQAMYALGTFKSSNDYPYGTPATVLRSGVSNITLALDKVAGPDVIFSDTFSVSSANADSALGYANYSSVVVLPSDLETTTLGKLEWLYVVAALYNREDAATNVVENVAARYTCNKNFIATNAPASAPRPKILWLTSFSPNGLGRLSCAAVNWQCSVIADVGADVVEVPSNVTTPAAFAPYFAQADVVIFANDNFNRQGLYSGPWYTETMQAAFNTSQAVVNKKVFDILGSRLNLWFDANIAEPDVLLLDLAQAMYGNSFVSSRSKKFLRNVFTEPVGAQFESASQCTDPTAPRYTSWTVGPCATAGGLPTTIPGVTGATVVDSSCPLKSGAGLGREVSGVVAAAAVAAAALAAAAW